MYCKYCGSTISADTVTCLSCGAKIDLNDGGQSFFDDNELDAWQSDSALSVFQTSMPKTEMRDPLPENDDFEEYEDETEQLMPTSVFPSSSEKKEKSILSYLNISSSNKLIIFCISSALAIVLLVVAIIAVLHSGNDKEENADPAYQQPMLLEPNFDNSQQAPGAQNPPAETPVENKVPKGMTEIQDIKILDKNQKEISHSCFAYIDQNNVLYISLDKVLKHEGFKSGKANKNERNRVWYEHKTSGKVIEIEKGTNKIWIKEPGGTAQTQFLAANSFNVGDNTYIPIKSFLGKYGYDVSKVVWNSKEKTLYFKK